jgi:anthranilate synthase/aminodeoxychorismate synthase-like glutamine amidotransferase
MILVIDNYDSFVHNLARYFRQLGCETVVVRNDQIDAAVVRKINPQAIVISPGPCTPNKAGYSIDAVKEFGSVLPILGICLGHQAIVQALGGTIRLANEPVHGRQSSIQHFGSPMFRGIKKSFDAGRYHSLVASIADLPDSLRVTARTDDGTIMAVEHKSLPLVGLQFHPESILTECGYQLLINFLKVAKIDCPTPSWLEETPLGNWGNYGGEEPNYSDRLSVKTVPAGDLP